MTRHPRLTVLAVVGLLVVAGCSTVGDPATSTTPAADDRTTTSTTTRTTTTTAPTTNDRTTTTTALTTNDRTTTSTTARTTNDRTTTSTTARTTDPGESSGAVIPVRGELALPFDVNRTYARTLRLTNRSGVAPPDQVYLYRPGTPWKPVVRDPFARVLLDARETSNFSGERRTGLVMAVPNGTDRRHLRFTVVHEFVHWIQFSRADDTPAMERAFSGGYHGRRAAVSVVEGSASYVALQYLLRYANRSRASILARHDEYRNASPAGKYVWAPYHFGRLYVARRADSPADHWRLYENPPETTEEVIHGLAPGSEPPRTLAVAVESDAWSVRDRETRGEMFARVVLTAELPESRAAEGAAGWGNDELLTLGNGSATGFAWVTRWDSPADAAEFREAFRAAMDRRGTRRDGRWTADGTAIRVERPSPDVVVVYAGPASLVADAGARAEGGNVTVSTRGGD